MSTKKNRPAPRVGAGALSAVDIRTEFVARLPELFCGRVEAELCFDLGDLYTESGQTLQCSFSSVSTPPIARVGAFFSICRDLQDCHSFAPLRIQNFSKNLPKIFHNFTDFLQNVAKVLSKFGQISTKFHQNFTARKVPHPLLISDASGCFRMHPEPVPVPAFGARAQYAVFLASNCARPAAALRD